MADRMVWPPSLFFIVFFPYFRVTLFRCRLCRLACSACLAMLWSYLFNVFPSQIQFLHRTLISHGWSVFFHNTLLVILHLVYGTNSPLYLSDTVFCTFTFTHGISSSSPSSLSPLASSLTRSVFHSEQRLGFSANLFLRRPFLFLSDWLDGLSDHPMILLCSTINGWICLHGVLD